MSAAETAADRDAAVRRRAEARGAYRPATTVRTTGDGGRSRFDALARDEG